MAMLLKKNIKYHVAYINFHYDLMQSVVNLILVFLEIFC